MELAFLGFAVSFVMLCMRKESNDEVVAANVATQQKIDTLRQEQRRRNHAAANAAAIDVQRLQKQAAAELRKKAFLQEEADQHAAWIAQQQAYWANKPAPEKHFGFH